MTSVDENPHRSGFSPAALENGDEKVPVLHEVSFNLSDC